MKIGILDYGCGNIYSLYFALKKINHEVYVVDKFENFETYDVLFLPGVGAFKSAMDKIKEFESELKFYANSGKKIIGICLGMQLLCTTSEEFGIHSGLDFIPGIVKKFNIDEHIIPHIGWNKVKFKNNIFKESFFYFLHSYKVTSDPKYTYGITNYNQQKFSSVIKKENIIGCQFHPEKSGKAGISFLKYLLELKN